MFGELHENAQNIKISYIFEHSDVIIAHFIIFFLSRLVQSWIEISFSNLRVRIKCFVVKGMCICSTTMAVHGFQNTRKPELWRDCTSICATISLGGKWILTK
jgi:hypothetical protein